MMVKRLANSHALVGIVGAAIGACGTIYAVKRGYILTPGDAHDSSKEGFVTKQQYDKVKAYPAGH